VYGLDIEADGAGYRGVVYGEPELIVVEIGQREENVVPSATEEVEV